GGCVRSSAPFTVVITTVNELGQAAFTVFPNPVSDHLELRAQAPIQRVQLLDAAGRTVLQEQRVATGRTAALDLGHLANGTYVLVVDMQGGTGHCRVVVDH
ncbi:MAG TPA: T9SS type A sorting domain-containing protein, partial [Flavobacteriales bacterium]|nr:T9SS type A sorting domain-containing protein [Flavobacteriales bacterium]